MAEVAASTITSFSCPKNHVGSWAWA
ncbi:hypothetical protein CCACVL1_30323, partial [Corchorus capsularis]